MKIGRGWAKPVAKGEDASPWKHWLEIAPDPRRLKQPATQIALGLSLVSFAGVVSALNLGPIRIDPPQFPNLPIDLGPFDPSKHLKELGKLPENVAKAAGDIAQGGKQAIQQVAEGTVTTISNATKGTFMVLEKSAGDTISTLERTGKNVIATATKAGSDVVATYSKGWHDATKQARASFDDAVEAGGAMLRYSERMAKDQLNGFDSAARRAREGKIADAVWHLGTDPLQAQEKNFFKATQESALINQAAGSAAAVYGGPGGAAAYAAWSTYRATGDADAAFRAGILAGATSQFGDAGTLPANTPISETIKRAAVAGAAGGIAVAAKGGDEAAIRDAFLKSGGSVLIQSGKNGIGAYSPKAAEALKLAECLSAKDLDCASKTTFAKDAKGRILKEASGLPKLDGKQLDPKAEIGKWTGVDLNSLEAKGQKLVTDVSKLPGTETIVLLNGKYTLTTSLGTEPTINYGQPAVVLTAVGTAAPFEFERKVGAKGSVGTKSGGNFRCSIGSHKRTIETTYKGAGCTSRYFREDGTIQVVWSTPSNAHACIGKVQEFVVQLKKKGVDCKQ